MKKVIIIFLALLTTFSGIWITKSKTPSMRPDSYANGFSDEEGLWWNVKVDSSNVDDKWVLDPEIPENYLPVPGEDELYMVVDENGHITGYRKRTKQADGSWVWEDVNPDIPEHYEAVEGLEDVYKVTSEDGTVKYYKYIRNEDDTFAFVEVDSKGNPIDDVTPVGDEIPDNYVHLANNVYAVLNDHGVVIRYKKRNLNDDGAYVWTNATKPENDGSSGPNLSYGGDNNNNNGSGNTPGFNGGGSMGQVTNPGGGQVINNSDGTFTEVESFMTTETTGGWIVTYETKVTKTYDKNGKLLSTRKEGPNGISRKQVTDSNSNTPDQSKIASSLNAEAARMSAGMSFKNDVANQVLAKLNAERSAAGKAPLKMNTGSNAYKLAQARAAAMATYNYSDYNSPLYGNLASMLSRFGLSSAGPTENTWRTTSKSADAIHAKFMGSSGQARLGSAYTNIGIAIVEKNGYYYICEVLID